MITPSDFEAIEKEVDSLLNIDYDNLDGEALRGTKIFVQLNNVYNREAAKLRDLTIVNDKMYLLRFRFYTGKADAKEYTTSRFTESITKTDVDRYLKADDSLNMTQTALATQERIVKFIEDSIKASRNRQFDIKNAIEWRKFQAGV